MRKIELKKMEDISGGGFWDGVCGAAGIARIAISAGWLTLNPIGVTLVSAAAIGCIVYYMKDK